MRIAVYDDESNWRETLADSIRDSGEEPVILDERFSTINECVMAIRERSDAAILDNRLTGSGFAPFRGVEAIKCLYLNGFPAILVSGWANAPPDIMGLQPYRRQLSEVIRKGAVNDNETTIVKAIDKCKREFLGEFTPERRPIRTALRVASEASNESAFHVIVPSWSTVEGVSVPKEVVPPHLHDKFTVDSWWFADVNVGADKSEELYFVEFEQPEVPPDDFLPAFRT